MAFASKLRMIAPALGIWALAAFGTSAVAQTPGGTLDKIRTSGKAVIGVREASPPMAMRWAPTPTTPATTSSCASASSASWRRRPSWNISP